MRIKDSSRMDDSSHGKTSAKRAGGDGERAGVRPGTRAAGNRRGPVRGPVRGAILTMLLLAVSAGGGYALGGLPLDGGIGTARTAVSADDAKYDLDGDSPFGSSVDETPEPSGPKLGAAEAGDYYLQTIAQSRQAWNDALNASLGGDLTATRAAAGKAAKALRDTAATLRARTWPDDVANAAASIADTYDERAEQASYVADAVGGRAGDALTEEGAYGVGEADDYLRGKLGLPAGTSLDLPVEITAMEDRGIQRSSTTADRPLSGPNPSAANDGKRIIAVTVRSRMPGTVSGLTLSFDVKSGGGAGAAGAGAGAAADGGAAGGASSASTLGTAAGDVDDIALAKGQSVVVPVAVDVTGSGAGSGAGAEADSGSGAGAGSKTAGARLVWSGLTVTDGHGFMHHVQLGDDYVDHAADATLDGFRW